MRLPLVPRVHAPWSRASDLLPPQWTHPAAYRTGESAREEPAHQQQVLLQASLGSRFDPSLSMPRDAQQPKGRVWTDRAINRRVYGEASAGSLDRHIP